MKIALGCDHAGFLLKQVVAETIRKAGHQVLDVGTDSPEPVDYPDIAERVGKAIVEKRAQRGILLCGSGVGACIAANKIPGVYAGVCHDTYSAHQGVEHDDMNVLCLGSRIIGVELARELTLAYLAARFSKEERHRRRVGKIRAIESAFLGKDLR
jgi:RpiB/LacA/LacB family sugar-phosphate isomerase